MKILDFVLKYWVIVVFLIAGIGQAALSQYKIVQLQTNVAEYKVEYKEFNNKLQAIQTQVAVNSTQLSHINKSLEAQTRMLNTFIANYKR